MSVAEFYHDHYRDVRRRLMGKPARMLSAPEPIEKVNMSLERWKVWQEVRDEKERRDALHEKQIADAIAIAASKYEPVTLRESTRQIKIRVAKKHGVSVRDIDGTARFHFVIKARNEAIAEVHRIWPEKGWCEIGRIFGKDHSSVINSLRNSGVYKGKLNGKEKYAIAEQHKLNLRSGASS